eukprot:TRINITY_DN1893_c0_g1_i11.p1 TRINITY_DN1893_c0_g1~~TRINITY_DN1893_c0_g1_i11.p1  ORF type:complete len:201 (+),score=34.50 TRINITY_DN1893_c0_g1_i11:382-984(+)
MSTLITILRNPILIQDLVGAKTTNIVRYSAHFTGYTIYDIVLVLLNRSLFSWSIMFHHLMFVLTGTLGNVFDTMYGLGCAWTLNEVSTIFLNQKWFFSKMNEYNRIPPNPRLVSFNLILFYLSFLVFRVGIHLWIDSKLILQVFLTEKTKVQEDGKLKESSPFHKFFAGVMVPGLGGLNIYWFYLINLQFIKWLKDKKSI